MGDGGQLSMDRGGTGLQGRVGGRVLFEVGSPCNKVQPGEGAAVLACSPQGQRLVAQGKTAGLLGHTSQLSKQAWCRPMRRENTTVSTLSRHAMHSGSLDSFSSPLQTLRLSSSVAIAGFQARDDAPIRWREGPASCACVMPEAMAADNQTTRAAQQRRRTTTALPCHPHQTGQLHLCGLRMRCGTCCEPQLTPLHPRPHMQHVSTLTPPQQLTRTHTRSTAQRHTRNPQTIANNVTQARSTAGPHPHITPGVKYPAQITG